MRAQPGHEAGAPPAPIEEGKPVAGPNDNQNKNIAKAKLRQQQERERAAKAAAQKRARIIAGAVAVLLVIGGGFGAAQLLGGKDDDTVATETDDDVVKDTTPPAPEGKENCVYAPDDSEETGGKDVGIPPLVAEATEPYKIKVETSKGDVELELDSKAAPCAVNSFVHLTRAKFFDNTECHRELTDPGYGILQCGDPTATGSGGAGYTFRDENLPGATYKKGTLAMANRGPNTNGSQFFLVFRDSQFQPAYTPFGKIVKDSSFETLESIAKDGVDGDKPKKKVVIEKVTVIGGPEASGEPATSPTSSSSPSPSPSASSSAKASPSSSPSATADDDEDESPSPSATPSNK
jgi:peptidyl-prolyl cis-trans isomerase B (cyclophilin B)